jgi:hypothetical protein
MPRAKTRKKTAKKVAKKAVKARVKKAPTAEEKAKAMLALYGEQQLSTEPACGVESDDMDERDDLAEFIDWEKRR